MTEDASATTAAEQEALDWITAQAEIAIDERPVEETLGYKLRQKEQRKWDSLRVGDVAPDGSVFAGLTRDGSQRIYAMPSDLGVTLTFNDAAGRVAQLNADRVLGHHDWQIPTLGQLKTLYHNQDKGALRDTFRKGSGSGSDFPGWYWSSTELRDHPSDVWDVRFSDGDEVWGRKDYSRLSCRPVRLVEASPCPAALCA